jgi:hypothetical protein
LGRWRRVVSSINETFSAMHGQEIQDSVENKSVN